MEVFEVNLAEIYGRGSLVLVTKLDREISVPRSIGLPALFLKQPAVKSLTNPITLPLFLKHSSCWEYYTLCPAFCHLQYSKAGRAWYLWSREHDVIRN